MSDEGKGSVEENEKHVDLSNNVQAKFVVGKDRVIMMLMFITSVNRIQNPLYGIPKNKLLRQVERFAHENDLDDILPYLQKGALLAQHPKEFETIPELDEADRVIIRRETTRQSALLPADSLTEISIRPMASARSSLYDRCYLQSRCRRPVSYLFFSA